MLSVLVLSYKVSIYKVTKNYKTFCLINIRKYVIFSLKTTAGGSKIKWKFPTWFSSKLLSISFNLQGLCYVWKLYIKKP